jgi:putative transcriptional regulator
MKKKYKSDVFAAVHESMQGLHNIGLIDAVTMRRFDGSCLVPVEDMAPEEIVAVRIKEGVSQAVFARYLEVSVGSVSKWERGEKHPSGPALKLLNMVKRKGLEAISV